MKINENYAPTATPQNISPAPKPPKKHRARIVIFAIILPLLWVVGGTLIFANLENIRDHITAWQNPLASNVAALADDAGLNAHGKFLLAASRAELNDRADFNRNCPIQESQAILLGCYAARRIYVFDVADTQISGIKSVIAAHEMLHAAYQRLSGGERAKVDKLLANELKSIDNPEILNLMKIYQQTEPGQEFNELHSLLATEEKSLSPELENYYRKYFANRAKVVAEYAKYQKVFDDLKAQATALQTQMTAEKSAIDAATAQYQRDADALTTDISAFNACANRAGCFVSQSQFNSQRANLVARQQTLADAAAAIQKQIDDYNGDVAKLNALGIEAEKLNQSLDSKAPAID